MWGTYQRCFRCHLFNKELTDRITHLYIYTTVSPPTNKGELPPLDSNKRKHNHVREKTNKRKYTRNIDFTIHMYNMNRNNAYITETINLRPLIVLPYHTPLPAPHYTILSPK